MSLLVSQCIVARWFGGFVGCTAVCAGLLPCAALGEVLFQPLGGLPGQPVSSQAWGVSADGSAVTGLARFGNTFQAFRLTEAGGMQGLGFLSATPSYGWGISGDGQTVVGEAVEAPCPGNVPRLAIPPSADQRNARPPSGKVPCPTTTLPSNG